MKASTVMNTRLTVKDLPQHSRTSLARLQPEKPFTPSKIPVTQAGRGGGHDTVVRVASGRPVLYDGPTANLPQSC